MATSDSEAPGSINFNDATQVHGWITQTVQQRVWRPRFFAAITAALNEAFDRAIDVAAFGSGAGHLAKEILGTCRVASCAAIDASALHDAARKHLGEAARNVRFVAADPQAADWTDELQPVDAVIAMPAAASAQAPDHPLSLLSRIREILKPGGLLLYCERYRQDRSQDSDALPDREKLPSVLQEAGFRRTEELLELGGMVLIRAVA